MHATMVACPPAGFLRLERRSVPSKKIRARSVLVFPPRAETTTAWVGIKEKVTEVVANFSKPIFTAVVVKEAKSFSLFSFVVAAAGGKFFDEIFPLELNIFPPVKKRTRGASCSLQTSPRRGAPGPLVAGRSVDR